MILKHHPLPLHLRLIGASLIVKLLIASPASGQVAPLVTDRPDFTESAIVVPKGQVQVEAGLTFESSSLDVLSGPEMLVRYSLHDIVELRLGVPNYVSLDDASTSGFGDSSIGAKVQLGPTNGWDIATIVALSLPTGESPFTSDKVDPEVIQAFGRGLTDNISLGTQAVISFPEVGGSRTVEFGGTLVFGTSLAQDVGGFAEIAFSVPEEGTAPVLLHGGLTFLAKPLLQLDLHAGVGLTDAAPDFFIGGGVSTRI